MSVTRRTLFELTQRRHGFIKATRPCNGADSPNYRTPGTRLIPKRRWYLEHVAQILAANPSLGEEE